MGLGPHGPTSKRLPTFQEDRTGVTISDVRGYAKETIHAPKKGVSRFVYDQVSLIFLAIRVYTVMRTFFRHD